MTATKKKIKVEAWIKIGFPHEKMVVYFNKSVAEGEKYPHETIAPCTITYKI